LTSPLGNENCAQINSDFELRWKDKQNKPRSDTRQLELVALNTDAGPLVRLEGQNETTFGVERRADEGLYYCKGSSTYPMHRPLNHKNTELPV
jgi:hypothetical protein